MEEQAVGIWIIRGPLYLTNSVEMTFLHMIVTTVVYVYRENWEHLSSPVKESTEEKTENLFKKSKTIILLAANF